MSTLRELFHGIGNNYNLVLISAGVSEELVDLCLIEKDPEKLKVTLGEIKSNLAKISSSVLAADEKLRQIHEQVRKEDIIK